MENHSYRWLASGNTGFLSLTVLLHRSWFFNYVGWDHFLWRLRRWCWRLRPGQSGQPFPSDLKIEIPMQCFDRKKKLCEVNSKKFHATKINKNLILLEVNRTNLFSWIWKSKLFRCNVLTKNTVCFCFDETIYYLDFNSNTTAIFSRTATKANVAKRWFWDFGSFLSYIHM